MNEKTTEEKIRKAIDAFLKKNGYTENWKIIVGRKIAEQIRSDQLHQEVKKKFLGKLAPQLETYNRLSILCEKISAVLYESDFNN